MCVCVRYIGITSSGRVFPSAFARDRASDGSSNLEKERATLALKALNVYLVEIISYADS